jgi:hypothetical protein
VLLIVGVKLSSRSEKQMWAAIEANAISRSRVRFEAVQNDRADDCLNIAVKLGWGGKHNVFVLRVFFINFHFAAESTPNVTHLAWVGRYDFWFPEHLELHAYSYQTFAAADYVYSQMASLVYWFFPAPPNKVAFALNNLLPEPCAIGVAAQSWNVQRKRFRFDGTVALKSKR